MFKRINCKRFFTLALALVMMLTMFPVVKANAATASKRIMMIKISSQMQLLLPHINKCLLELDFITYYVKSPFKVTKI